MIVYILTPQPDPNPTRNPLRPNTEKLSACCAVDRRALRGRPHSRRKVSCVPDCCAVDRRAHRGRPHSRTTACYAFYHMLINPLDFSNIEILARLPNTIYHIYLTYICLFIAEEMFTANNSIYSLINLRGSTFFPP